jgi:hypothetical protein
MRERFISTAAELLDHDPRLAVVLADISADQFAGAAARHPDRVINVGIREQLRNPGRSCGRARTGRGVTAGADLRLPLVRNLQDCAFVPIDERPEKAHSLYYPLVIY